MKRNVTVWDRLARVDARVWDGVLAASLLMVQFLAVGSAPNGPNGESDILPALAILATTIPLAWRRRTPLIVLLIVAAGIVAAGTMEGLPIVTITLSIAAYSAAAHRSRSRALVGALIAATVAGLAFQLMTAVDIGPVERTTGVVFIVWIPAFLGLLVQDRRLWGKRDRERMARDAASAERARMARELHDVVAHAMGVMVVQAGGARTILRRDPEEVERALRRIEDTGRTGLSEMRRLLESERNEDGDALLSPNAGLQHLDELVDQMRAAGLSVDVEVRGARQQLAPGVDLSAYRIVQESLTNTLKHAGSASARVLLRYEEGALHVEITDDGGEQTPVALSFAGAGRGLIGMRERVSLLDGEFDAGPRPGGGFEVRARLPLRAAP